MSLYPFAYLRLFKPDPEDGADYGVINLMKYTNCMN